MEEAAHRREFEIMGQITELFMLLSPVDRERMLVVLSEDESDKEGESEDDDD